MMFEDGHPNISHSDWLEFLDWHNAGKTLPTHPFDR